MFGILIAVGVLIVIGILILMFRVEVLVGVARKKDEADPESGYSNNINAVLGMLFIVAGFAAFFWYSFSEFDRYNLPLASEHGAATDELFWVTMYITGIVFVATNILLYYFAYKYRYNKNRVARFYPHNSKLEIIWTVIPAIVLTLLVGKGLIVWGDIMEEAPEGSEVIEIMGYQFAWEARYSGKDDKFGAYDYMKIDNTNIFGLDLNDENSYDDFSALEIHIPKGETVLLKIRARDVLHSVFLPHFRVKMDAVPGMNTQFKFIATKSTADMREELNDPEFNYELACTEICGRGHFSMRKILVVDEPAEYEAWKAKQRAWLKINPDYLSKVPEGLRETAIIKSGITKEEIKDLEASL